MKWKTADGREMEICDMTDSHLLNAHRYVRGIRQDYNNMLAVSTHPVFAPRGEYAQIAFEEELDALFEHSIRAAAVKPFLEKEMKKRGLKELPIKKMQKLPDYELVEDLGYGQIWRLKEGEKKMAEDKSKYTHEFYVAGVQYHDLSTVIKEVKAGETLTLEPDPENKYDPNAIKILRGDVWVGFVPAKLAPIILAAMSASTSFLSEVSDVTCEVIHCEPSAKPWQQLYVGILED